MKVFVGSQLIVSLPLLRSKSLVTSNKNLLEMAECYNSFEIFEVNILCIYIQNMNSDDMTRH